MIVLVGDVRDIGMHTFTVSEVPIRGKTYILATESIPHGRTDLFSNIEDAALFLFWKFACYSPQNDKIQISYALLYSPVTFINTTMLTASLTAARVSLAEKLKGMNGVRRSRACAKNHVNYSDNVAAIPIQQEELPVKSHKKKGATKKGNKPVSPGKQTIPCKNHAAGLGNAASNTAEEETRGGSIFRGDHFIQTIDTAIFPNQKDHVNVEDNENEEDSSFSDPELCPIEDIEEDESAIPQEFFPLASQCSPSFSISKRPIVHDGKHQPLSSHWKTCFKGTGSTISHVVRSSKASSLIRSNEIDPNLISKKTASFNRKSSTTTSYQSAAPVNPEKIKDLIVVPIQTQLSSHQYKAKEQFIKLDRESLKKIPLSGVYEDTSINNSIISLDEFRDAVNDLSVRLHYSCPNLGREHDIDLFNNAAILPGKQFVSRYDDIELRVYSERPTSYLMICSDIHKSLTLRLAMCKSRQKV